jgi:hypothetical protein
MKPCHCILVHALTPEDRERAVERLEYARITGDLNGIVLTMIQLGPCPCQDQPEDPPDEE